ncbi:MAG TPA: hypothetical protein VF553_13940 [Pyrinomonadaceae bacterium]|jgi:hypothetical protein
MAEDHKTQMEHKATRIIEWLKEHRAEFEGEGIGEDTLSGTIGMAEDEVREVVDYLENHEDVVRYPQGVTAPSRFLLKPGRNWPAIRDGN